MTMDDKSWTFVATYTKGDFSADGSKTYSDDLNAGMKTLNVYAFLSYENGDMTLSGTTQGDIDLTAKSDSKSGAAALGAFGVALAASYLF